MNDDELKKRLSVLRATPVPGGYWASYWPRLRMRLGRMSPADAAARETVSTRSFLGWAPVCAGLAISLAGYWMGSRRPSPAILPLSGSPLMLTSDSPQADARRAFKEMLDLFPNRVNWISFVDGKVDFSISSVAYKDSQPLVPLILSIPHGHEPFHAQVMLRPGQDAVLQAPWDAHSTLTAKLQLDAAGREVNFSCRLAEGDHAAALEGSVHPKEGEALMAGSLRWQDQLIPIQIARLGAEEANTHHEPAPKIQL